MRVRLEVLTTAARVEVVVRGEDGTLLGVTQTDPLDDISVTHMAQLWTSVTFDVPPEAVEVVDVVDAVPVAGPRDADGAHREADGVQPR